MGSVVIELDSGTVVQLTEAAADAIYDLLWGEIPSRGPIPPLAVLPMRGAVSAAGKIRSARVTGSLGRTVVLDAPESLAFTQARTRSRLS